RDVSPQTRAVLMSGYATARDYQRAGELGAVRVLCKPFTPSDLIQCIHQAVECETGFRGSVHGLSLVDMLQMYHYARRSVTIAVDGSSHGRPHLRQGQIVPRGHPGGRGAAAGSHGGLHLRKGQIVHAEHRGESGERAVAAILAIPGGTIGTSA